MIGVPDGPSEQIIVVCEPDNSRNVWEDGWPDNGMFWLYDRETQVHERQFAHHKPEQLWSRDK